MNAALRARGVVVAGSYGPYSDKLFRIGHMGSQANKDTLAVALDEIAAVLEDLSLKKAEK